MAELDAIAFPFTIDRGAGRIRAERDYEAYVVQLIRQVLLTNLGERINRPDFGAQIRSMVFAPNNPAAATYGRALIYQALDRWLSDFIRTEAIELRAEEATLWIDVEYTLIARGERRFLNVEVAL